MNKQKGYEVYFGSDANVHYLFRGGDGTWFITMSKLGTFQLCLV